MVLAKIAEKSGRVQDMISFTHKIIQMGDSNFSKEERNVVANCFKTAAGNLRAELRALISIQQSTYFGQNNQ